MSPSASNEHDMLDTLTFLAIQKNLDEQFPVDFEAISKLAKEDPPTADEHKLTSQVTERILPSLEENWKQSIKRSRSWREILEDLIAPLYLSTAPTLYRKQSEKDLPPDLGEEIEKDIEEDLKKDGIDPNDSE